MRKLFIFLFFVQATIVFAQTQKQKVLVCFFNDLNFETKYPSTKIAEINKMESNNIVDSLQFTFMKGLQKVNSETFEFIALKDFENNYFVKKASINFQKKPIHYHRDLNNIPLNEFQFLLNKYEADAIVFINHYLITKARVSDEAQSLFMLDAARLNASVYLDSKRISYSRHYIDFDIYNFEMEEIDFTGDYLLEFPRLNLDNYQSNGLDFLTLERTYQIFGEHLVEQNYFK